MDGRRGAAVAAAEKPEMINRARKKAHVQSQDKISLGSSLAKCYRKFQTWFETQNKNSCTFCGRQTLVKLSWLGIVFEQCLQAHGMTHNWPGQFEPRVARELWFQVGEPCKFQRIWPGLPPKRKRKCDRCLFMGTMMIAFWYSEFEHAISLDRIRFLRALMEPSTLHTKIRKKMKFSFKKWKLQRLKFAALQMGRKRSIPAVLIDSKSGLSRWSAIQSFGPCSFRF